MSNSIIILKVSEILAASNALAQLNGFQKAVGETVALIPYKLDDSTRWNIAKDRKILAREVEVFQEANNALIFELSPKNGDVTKEDGPTRQQFQARIKAINDREVELPGLLKIKKAALLKDEANPVPGTVLEALMPLIDDGELAPAKPQPEGGDQ